MSYELRTPLTSIGGFAELLGGGYAGELSPKAGDYVSAILESVEPTIEADQRRSRPHHRRHTGRGVGEGAGRYRRALPCGRGDSQAARRRKVPEAGRRNRLLGRASAGRRAAVERVDRAPAPKRDRLHGTERPDRAVRAGDKKQAIIRIVDNGTGIRRKTCRVSSIVSIAWRRWVFAVRRLLASACRSLVNSSRRMAARWRSSPRKAKERPCHCRSPAAPDDLAERRETAAAGAALAQASRAGDVITLSVRSASGRRHSLAGSLPPWAMRERCRARALRLFSPMMSLSRRCGTSTSTASRIRQRLRNWAGRCRDAVLLVEWPERAGVKRWPDSLRLSLEFAHAADES